jgi:hypothetical protein
MQGMHNNTVDKCDVSLLITTTDLRMWTIIK